MSSKVKDMKKRLLCRKATPSYGIIAFTKRNEEILFLMSQRRDTFSYECFLRGLLDLNTIERHIGLMTFEEKERMVKFDFEMLWKDLWVSEKRKFYKAEYSKAKSFYDAHFKTYKPLFESPTLGVQDIPWDFPKGRMNFSESEVDCALREFEEETKIKKRDVIVLTDLGRFENVYTGTDGKLYRTVYFVAYVPYSKYKTFSYVKCPHGVRNEYISEEVYTMNWFRFTELSAVLNDHKMHIVNAVMSYLLFGQKIDLSFWKNENQIEFTDHFPNTITTTCKSLS
jgi:8-oxo-dGTP pyrophosphatase MutT (NUDIX family)